MSRRESRRGSLGLTASKARLLQQQYEPLFQPVSLYYLKYIRQRQQAVLMLQHCAILSQLNRHQDALDIAKATSLLIKEITESASHIIKSKRQNLEEKIRVKDIVKRGKRSTSSALETNS